MVEAMKNLENIQDARRENGAKPAQAAEMIENGDFTDDYAVFQQNGGLPDDILQGCNMPKTVETFTTLEERLASMMQSLGVSKACCKGNLMTPYQVRFILAPNSMLHGIKRNRAGNAKKTETTQAGRAALKLPQRKAAVDQDDLESGTEKDMAGHQKPKKLKQSRKRKATNKNAHAERPSKARQIATHTPLLSVLQHPSEHEYPSAASPTVSASPRSTYSSPHTSSQAYVAPPDSEAPLRRVICNLLGVEMKHSTSLSLNDLRLYAHAYMPGQSNGWVVAELHGHRGNGAMFTSQDGKKSHIAVLLHRFYDMALNRGDIAEDGSLGEGRRSQREVVPSQAIEYEALGISR